MSNTKSLGRIRFSLYRLLIKFKIGAYFLDSYGDTLNLIRRLYKETELGFFVDEAYRIFHLSRCTEKIEGDLAEVGVYRGGSATLICEAKGDRKLHLFETFQGMPETGKYDSKYYKGQLSGSLEDVKACLSKYPEVYFYPGEFPSTVSDDTRDKKYSFVHLDADIYKATLDALEFFYPRMSKGGLILIHDYPEAQGVKEAVDEFFKDRPEPVMQIGNVQCLISK